jgi:hypothetical protein
MGRIGPKISRCHRMLSAGASSTMCGAILRVAASKAGPGTSCTTVAPRARASSSACSRRSKERWSMMLV